MAVNTQRRVLIAWDFSNALSESTFPSGLFSADIGSPASVSNATNAEPIVLTVGASHGFTSGMIANVSGVTGNTAANGAFPVTVSGNDITLLFSSGNGTYSSGGSAQRQVRAIGKQLSLGTVRKELAAIPWNPCSGTGSGSVGAVVRYAYS